MEDTLTDDRLARDAAVAAGRLLSAVRTTSSATGRDLGNEGDLRSNELLLDLLGSHRPRDSVLSEESVDNPVRLSADRVWIIDPLDGTREFTEPGRVDWAVHVALWEQGRLAAGAVALPALDLVFDTETPAPVPPAPGRPLRIAVSRTRPPQVATALADRLGAHMVGMGSAGFKVAAILRGQADAYIHAGGQYEWDSAAPVAVAQRVGLHASRITGDALAYNRPNPLLPDLVVAHPDVADRVMGELADLLEHLESA